MSREDIEARIKEIIGPLLHDLGFELADLELKRMSGKGLLRVYIDKEQGVGIDDCVLASREISAVLDVEDPIPYSYVLEVSSPGLDRPLKKPEDFKRYSGRMVRVVTREPVGKETFFVGQLEHAGDTEIVLLLPKGIKATVQYDNISKARLEVEV